MNPTPLACWLLTATLLAAADAPQGDTPPRNPQPQVERPQRDRANAQGGNSDRPSVQRQGDRTPTATPLSGWVYIPPQGGQNGPIPAKPDFIPGNPGQDPVAPGRTIQPPFGKGQGAPIEPGRVANAQPQNQVQRRTNALTPDEQHKLQATMEKLKDNADLKEAREVALKARKSAEEATRKEHELTQDAALKLDPSLAPLFEKMHKAVAVQNQPQVRRGEQTPARREEPAR
ncbi:uncharacterized protein DKFZp434B061 [Verrucomicrobiota bacterium]|jgi:hypothetical protein|nr:uncharacterized protein DKFZp434B061 [Verrucomicrobiota bacterium]